MNLINDILDFSKIDSAGIELERVDFNLSTCLDEVAANITMTPVADRLRYSCVIAPEINCLLHGDPGRLRQVVMNFVGNAIKIPHTEEVQVSVHLVTEESDSVCLRFEVSGVGTHVHSEHDPDLSICEYLVGKMGGELGVEKREGQGPVLWFTSSFVSRRAEVPKEKEYVSSANLSGRKILLVEESATERSWFKPLFSEWGCFFEEAEKAETAMAKIRQANSEGEPFDTVVMDMYLPDMSGELLAAYIKNDESLGELNLVMVTPAGNRGEASRLQKLGLGAYLTKPLKKNVLYDCLKKVVLDSATGMKRAGARIITRHSIVEGWRSNMRVVIAEDDSANRLLGLAILENRGFKADAAVDGRELLSLLEKNHYDLVLMDCQMPVVNGFEATKTIREWQGLDLQENDESLAHKIRMSHIPIIAVTAGAMLSDREKCIAAGMDDYIAKPVAPEKLIEVVEKWLVGEGTS